MILLKKNINVIFRTNENKNECAAQCIFTTFRKENKLCWSNAVLRGIIIRSLKVNFQTLCIDLRPRKQTIDKHKRAIGVCVCSHFRISTLCTHTSISNAKITMYINTSYTNNSFKVHSKTHIIASLCTCIWFVSSIQTDITTTK